VRGVGAAGLLGLVAVASAMGVSSSAAAHTRSISDSRWVVDDRGAEVRVRVSLLDLSALEGAFPGILAGARAGMVPEPFAQHLQESLRLHDERDRCTPVAGSFRALDAGSAHVRYGWRVRCAEGAPRYLHANLLMDAVPAHLHFATVQQGGGAEIHRVLDPSSRVMDLPRASAPRGAGAVLAEHLPLGIEHILTGWDHLLFLLALLLWSPRLRDTILIVTGFTLGHSVTLGLAAMGWVSPREAAVEALIGLSIAIVAAENIWLARGRRGVGLPAASVAFLLALAIATGLAGHVSPAVPLGMALFAACQLALLGRLSEPARWRWTAASVFGLVHGLGFAGALVDLVPSTGELVPALLGFNLGVEVGQLAVVLAVWPLLTRWSRSPARADWLVHGGSAAAVGAGLFWYVTRAFG
jgi:hypothetical protein